MLRKVIKFTLVICCMLIIFMFSSDSGTASSKKSDSVIINLVECVFVVVSKPTKLIAGKLLLPI